LWNPAREAIEIPLAVQNAVVDRLDKSDDWPSLPADLRSIFESGNLLVTSSQKGMSHYSVLMAVVPSRNVSGTGGRTGVLLRDGLPIIVVIKGKEFLAELKGVGTPEGGYNYARAYRPGSPRGTLQLEQSEREFRNLESERRRNPDFQTGDTPRAAAQVKWKKGVAEGGFTQGFLIRLSPGSIRATFAENEALTPPAGVDRWRDVAFQLLRQFGLLLGRGLLLGTHAENLVVLNNWQSYAMTDLADARELHEFHPLSGSFPQCSKQRFERFMKSQVPDGEGGMKLLFEPLYRWGYWNQASNFQRMSGTGAQIQ